MGGLPHFRNRGSRDFRKIVESFLFQTAPSPTDPARPSGIGRRRRDATIPTCTCPGSLPEKQVNPDAPGPDHPRQRSLDQNMLCPDTGPGSQTSKKVVPPRLGLGVIFFDH